MIPDPDKIRFWGARAQAYDALCRRWDVFAQLADRLIDLLPADLEGEVLDIGAGTGQTTDVLLARHSRCRSTLIEPSEAMLDLARKRLAGRPARFLAMGLDGGPVHELRVVAALASASMQFVDLEPGFRTLAHIVAPGGRVAFNLWWHHWEDTAGLNCMTGYRAIARTACEDAGLPPPSALAVAAPVARTRKALMSAADAHGFHLLGEHRDEIPTPVGYGVDYAAMDPQWPIEGLAAEARQAVLAKMLERAQGRREPLVSTRFVFRRDGASSSAT